MDFSLTSLVHLPRICLRKELPMLHLCCNKYFKNVIFKPHNFYERPRNLSLKRDHRFVVFSERQETGKPESTEEDEISMAFESYMDTKQKFKTAISGNSSKSPEIGERLAKLRNYEGEFPANAKSLIVKPLSRVTLNEVTQLLSSSFADLSPMNYKPLLDIQLKVYLQQRLLLVPFDVVLVGQLKTQEPEESEPKLTVVSTVELSFSADTKPYFLTLNPPPDSPYLSNMAVLHKYRRQGIGKATLLAAEDVCRSLGFKTVHLHCRLIDEIPCKIYQDSGYVIEKTDNALASTILFQQRRHLMKKTLN